MSNKKSTLVGIVLVLSVFFVWFFFENRQGESGKKINNLSELFYYCGNVKCGEVASCEGKIISVVGFIDSSNLSVENFFSMMPPILL